MGEIFSRILSQKYFLKRRRLLLLIVALIIIILKTTHVWLAAVGLYEGDPYNSSASKNPSFYNEKIQSLHRQIRELKSQLHSNGLSVPDNSYLPTIYVITPTYTRPNQLAELNRLRNVLLHVPHVWWLLVEDRESKSEIVKQFLAHSGVPHTLLCRPTPQEWKLEDEAPRWTKPRGSLQRNAALQWLRKNVDPRLPAVVYFADDDNSYSIELFDEMRHTSRVSVWPVGLVGGVMVERPICECLQSADASKHKPAVTGWLVGWMPQRQFPIDMAGFAVNLKLLVDNPDAEFSLDSKLGHMESDFLSRLVTRKQLEPRAECCTKVLVWHMNAKKPNLKEEAAMRAVGRRTDQGIIV